MKKFISFVMAAAMVASLVPATAFAANGDVKATAKVVDAWTRSKDTMEDLNGAVAGADVPELQLKITSTDYQKTDDNNLPVAKITVTLDNADFTNNADAGIRVDSPAAGSDVAAAEKTLNDAEDALDAAKDATAAAQTAYDQAAAAVDTSSVTATTEENAWIDAQSDTRTAAKDLKDKQDAEAAAEEAYWTQVESGGAASATTQKEAWDTAKEATATAQKAYDDAVEAEAAAKEAYETALQDAIDAYIATQVTDEKDALDAAKAAEATAQDDYDDALAAYNAAVATGVVVDYELTDDNEMEITVTGFLAKDDIIFVDLDSVMDKTSKNATVSVDSKMVTADDMAYVIVEDAGFSASVKKTVAVAEEEVTYLHSNGLKLKETVLGSFQAQVGEEVSLKLSKGFEFVDNADVKVNDVVVNADIDGNEITFVLTQAMLNDVDEDGLCTLTITGPDNEDDDARGLKVEATSAKADTVGTITAKIGALDKATVEVIKAVDYLVVMSVDEDEDVPVMYSGVNVDNDGITDDSDHETLEITLEETFPGAWSSRQGFNITLPEGVYVTEVEIVDQDNFLQNGDPMTDVEWMEAFENAYQDGDHANFEFGKRVFDDVNKDLEDDPATLTFKLTVVADPGFEGDVEVGFEGALVESQSVVAAKFVVPYTVTAEQNDLKIDSRYTSIPTDIVVKEAADGLWDDGNYPAAFVLGIEKGLISFEDDATFTVDKDSELEIDDDMWDWNGTNDALYFEVTDTSDAAATVTISDMELFMERNIPAGAYALELTTSMSDAYDQQLLFAPDDNAPVWDGNNEGDNFVDDVADYSNVVKDSFINVVTAPRDEDGFTTKITVPVGESYIIAGEVKVEIDTPAYINANGYTMLPLRAVAVALGIDNNSVLWDQTTRTATILYGNRVVSMQNGASVMYINGQAVATKAGVEITNDRTFLSLRDLGTAMNVTDISWDAATRTAYLNAGEVEA